MKAKTFDCVQMMRRGADLVRKELEGKSIDLQLEYWQRGTDDLRRLQQKLKRKS